jgi:ATP-dependent DNA helicase DinG
MNKVSPMALPGERASARVASVGDELVGIIGPGGLLHQRLPGYEDRPAQLAMARSVRDCLQERGKLVVEAGTGTGKTLSYLVPAILSGLKVAISTGTKTLQEQIYRKDIPMLLGQLEVDLPVACLKGISNYLCLRRLEAVRRSPELLPDPLLARLLEWAAVTETGDRAELADLPDDSPLWAEVSPTPETRLGLVCPFFEECFVTRRRREAAAARLLVVNHHLLLADLALRSRHVAARVIPPFEALVLDEAHHIESIATAFFGSSFSSRRLTSLCRDVRRATILEKDEPGSRLCRHLEESGAELFHLLGRELPSLELAPPAEYEGGALGRRRLGASPLGGTLQSSYFVVDTALEALTAHLHLCAGGREDLENLAARLLAAREELALFAEPPARGFIFWAESQRGWIALHASPVEVGLQLRETLFFQDLPIVLTSATLSTARLDGASSDRFIEEEIAKPPARGPRRSAVVVESLDYFRERVGLDGVEGVEERVLPSPFHFERQVLLYLPRDLPHPQDPDFILRAGERACQLIDITGGRALVLFTSYRNLQAARGLLAEQLAYPVLCQGDQPRSLLLERFRRDIASVLLATSSFWEGVDIVGESLSLVIIDKLPFAPPGDPLTAARIERLQERGVDPFLGYQLPQAALALKQGFGRLIRHRDDTGIVAILDRRLHERPYGKALLGSLPACPRTSDLLRVRTFAKEMRLLPAIEERDRFCRP